MVALAGMVLTAKPASAHPILSPSPACPGTQVDHRDPSSGQISVFEYFSSANGGTYLRMDTEEHPSRHARAVRITVEVCPTK